MSYILDALKRSERERSLGSIEKLHTPDTGGTHGDSRFLMILLFVLALLIALLVAMAWVYRGALAELLGDDQTLAPDARPSTATDATQPKPGFLDSTRVVVPDQRPEPSEPLPALEATPRDLPATDERQDASHKEPLDLASLPGAIRTRLPPLKVSAVSFSEDAARRFVLIDGSIYREGEYLPQGILVEEIHRTRIILSTLSERFFIHP